jgi:hypothetical protein
LKSPAEDGERTPRPLSDRISAASASGTVLNAGLRAWFARAEN